MIESEFTLLLLTLIVGVIIVVAMLLKGIALQVGLPAIVTYLLLGVGIQVIIPSDYLQMEMVQSVFGFLAEIGIISLLFRVGLESNIAGLCRQLPKASIILLGNLVASGSLGVAVTFYGLHWSLVTSLMVGVALMATSVGISVSVWQDEGALKSSTGELLLDIAELDDIVAIAFMSLLFALLPYLQETQMPLYTNGEAHRAMVQAISLFCLRGLLFGGCCIVFSRYLERPMTRLFEALEPTPDPMITIAGIGFITAALAGFMGFSVAVGAFLAGLVFSRDPDAVIFDTSFGSLSDFFVPFFFLHLGMGLDLQVLPSAVGLGLMISAIAILGKLIGTGLPAYFTVGRDRALLLSVSMIPRAEIAMIIIQKGEALGPKIIPPTVFGSMIMMSLLTCILTPICLRPLLHRWTLQRRLV